MSKIPKIIEQMKSEFNLRTTIWKIKINFHAKLMYLILIQVDTYKNIVHSLPEARNGYKYIFAQKIFKEAHSKNNSETKILYMSEFGDQKLRETARLFVKKILASGENLKKKIQMEKRQMSSFELHNSHLKHKPHRKRWPGKSLKLTKILTSQLRLATANLRPDTSHESRSQNVEGTVSVWKIMAHSWNINQKSLAI